MRQLIFLLQKFNLVRYFGTIRLIIRDRFLILLEVKSCTEELYNSIAFFFEANGILFENMTGTYK